jgi:DNA-binding response OmpR family regulator
VNDAWIYGEPGGPAAGAARTLAELGYTPQILPANGSLRPANGDGKRLPSVVVVSTDTADTCRRLSADDDLAQVPVIVAVGLEQLELGEGLVGGHELVIQPYTSAELQARISRARRRLNGLGDDDDLVRLGSLEVNLATYEVTVAGRPVDFTYMEYELLKFFVTHPGRAFSRESLLSHVWGYDYYGGARTVDVHVRRVRAKLGQEHAGRIRTVRSVGYRWDGG